MTTVEGITHYYLRYETTAGSAYNPAVEETDHQLTYNTPVTYTGSWIDPEVTFVCECESAHTSWTAELGDTVTVPSCSAKSGYTFAGWYD